MDYRYKRQRKKKYRIKPLPIIILIITIILLIAVVVFFAKTISDDKKSSQSGPSTTDGADIGGKISDTPNENQSAPPPSKTAASSDVPSSKSSSSESEKTASAPSAKGTSEVEEAAVSAAAGTGWNLILLNPKVAITDDLNFKKTKFDSEYVDSRAAPAYQAMYDAAKKSGITLYLRSGYRSMQTQRTNYNAAADRYIKQGKTKEEAIKLTRQYYTSPGHSEHHSGLAFDIITPEYHKTTYTLDDRFAQTEAYSWLIKNCTDYGFILRYPQDKKAITEINYEPWHYRYVGIDHAKAITKNGWCLEEYLEKIKSEFMKNGDAAGNAAYYAFAESFAKQHQ